MAKVTINPMPEKYRSIPKRLQPGVPPIFTDCGKDGPTPEDIELAHELFKLLDEESKDWYRRNSGTLFNGL